MSFNKLKLIDPILKAIEERGYKEATYIQKKAIPHVLGRKNLLITAKKGSGKTASYTIPIVQLIHRIDKNSTEKPVVRALVITSRDDLSAQVGKTFRDYSKHTIVKHVFITDADDLKQINILNEGVNVLIGTAETVNKIYEKKPEALADVKMLVLDEFDVTMNAAPDGIVKGLLEAIPNEIQTICFAEKTSEELDALMQDRMKDAVKFEVTGKPRKSDKGKKKKGPSNDKNKSKDGKKQDKPKKKKKKGGGRRSTEMSDKLKAKFLWPLEK